MELKQVWMSRDTQKQSRYSLRTLGGILGIAMLALVLTLGIVPLSHASNPISRDGYYHGIFLGGKVKVVNYGADIKVKVVNSFANLKVKPVTAFPDDVGEWQFVSYGEDFTIQYVNSFPDITIQFVSSFPGVR